MIEIEVTPTLSRLIGNIPEQQFNIIRHKLSWKDEDSYFVKRALKINPEQDIGRHFLITEKKMLFQTGLLKRVCFLLEQQGIDYQINDTRIDLPPDHFMPLREDITLRDYQKHAVEVALKEKCGLLRVCTGGGKTLIGCTITALLERNTVIIVHRKDLLRQFVKVLNNLMMFREVIGQIGMGVYKPNLITVCTMQTICAAFDMNYSGEEKEEIFGARGYRDLILKTLEDAKVVIQDEVHHAPCNSIQEILKCCKNATWRIGLSATDWREDGGDLAIEASFGPRIVDISLSDLVPHGFIVPAKITMHTMHTPPIQLLKKDKDNWHAIYKHYYTNNQEFHWQILQQNQEWYDQGKHILTLVKSVQQGHKLEKLHNKAGIKTLFLSGKNDDMQREKGFKAIEEGRIRHLIGTSIADEGLDLPILDCLNLAGGGKSTVSLYQRIGRVVRAMPGKTHAEVVDYHPREHYILSRHSKIREFTYKKESCFSFTEEE